MVCAGFAALAALAPRLSAQVAPRDSWTSEFNVDKADLASTGRNPYFVLEPDYRLILEGGRERLVITVLNETRMVDGVETRVVEERETENGKLVEVSRNYYAISRRTNSVFYFGEDVDTYRDGVVNGHEGSWLSGSNGARFGLMMPGEQLLKGRYYQELAPGIAMDRAEIDSVSENVRTPAAAFQQVLKVAESTPLEVVHEYKYYVKGIGLVQDGSAKLVKYGNALTAGQ
ncbi:MAG TPA: hypothetical protein VEP46_09300 [Vicinamibacterales bacterium]|nr:hypothetical protein [Vicinamibacterales bacterium]